MGRTDKMGNGLIPILNQVLTLIKDCAISKNLIKTGY